MLQRIQTIWLTLAAICAFLTFRFPFYTGNRIDANNVKAFEQLTASRHLLLSIPTILVIAGALIAIFLYKNRKLQLRIIILAIIISLINLFHFYLGTKKFVLGDGTYSLTALFAILVPIFLLLAARNVYKDEKLVKSMDRLR